MIKIVEFNQHANNFVFFGVGKIVLGLNYRVENLQTTPDVKVIYQRKSKQ